MGSGPVNLQDLARTLRNGGDFQTDLGIFGDLFTDAGVRSRRAPPPDGTGEDQEHRATPASMDAVSSLPRIKVTKHDIEQNEGTACPICLEELAVGEPAMRVPCGHLYHEACLNPWLRTGNQCPVCRYELPSVDAEHERGRAARMRGRRPRLRYSDLSVKSARELTCLARFFGIDVAGCLEKQELLDRLTRSGCVELIPEPLSHAVLEAMSIQGLKAEMLKRSIDVRGCLEKGDMIEKLVLCGHVSHKPDSEGST